MVQRKREGSQQSHDGKAKRGGDEQFEGNHFNYNHNQ
jgi:hypothetical protein